MTPRAKYIRDALAAIDAAPDKELAARNEGFMLGMDIRQDCTPDTAKPIWDHYAAVKRDLRAGLRAYPRPVLCAFESGLSEGAAQ